MNSLIKRIKRIAAGMGNFANFRIRALLMAGNPDWSLLSKVLPVPPTHGVLPALARTLAESKISDEITLPPARR